MSTDDPQDRIVELLRGLDPGEPPVALGPGAALRGIAARRRTRRHALGAALAIALVGGGVAGGFLKAREDAGTGPVAAGPMADSSVLGLATAKPPTTPPSSPPAIAWFGTPPAAATVAPSRPADSSSPAAQSSHADSARTGGPAQVVLTITGGRTGSYGGNVFDVGDAVTVTVSVADGDDTSAWFVSSYSAPGAGEEMSLVSCASYKASGGKGRPALEQSWSPHLNSPGNFLVSVDVTDICGKGGTRHVEQWVSVVDPDASPTPTPSPSGSPTPAPTSEPASASTSPTVSPTASPSH